MAGERWSFSELFGSRTLEKGREVDVQLGGLRLRLWCG